MRGLSLILVLALALMLAPTLVLAKNIEGYKTPYRHWVLRDNIKNIELDGLAEISVEHGFTAFAGDHVTLQFNGQDTETFTMLLFKHKRLQAIMIGVREEERGWDYLCDYYRERYGKAIKLVAPGPGLRWDDDDDDMLFLQHNTQGELGEQTVILYMTNAGWNYFYDPAGADDA